MNRLPARIAAVQQHGSLSLVDATVGTLQLTATLVGAADDIGAWHPGMAVTLVFKETEVALARNLSGLISMRNRMPARVTAVIHGELLSRIMLAMDGHSISSVITTRSAHALSLAVGDQVECLVKANDMTVEPGAGT